MTITMVDISALLLLVAAGATLSGLAPRRLRWLVIVLPLLVALIPSTFGSLWLWVKGVVGELSVVTLVLLLAYILRKALGLTVFTECNRLSLYAMAMMSGLLLYPAALGNSMHDPYALGYGPWISIAVLVLALLAWWFKLRVAAVIFTLVVLAAEYGLMTSVNTWDYLLDPLLWFASPFMLAAHTIRTVKEPRKSEQG